MDSLARAAEMTHNTSINKFWFLALQLVTDKTVVLPILSMGNKATESKMDAEAVQKTIEMLKKTRELCEPDMRKMLKECQQVRALSYQHHREYSEGGQFWYQQ